MNTTKYALLVLIASILSLNVLLSKATIDTNYRDNFPPIRYYGDVVDAKGKPIPNVEVKIICYRDGGTYDSTFKTNKLGKYDFKYKSLGEEVFLNFKKGTATLSVVNIPTGFLQSDLGFKVIYDKEKSKVDCYDKEWDLLLDCGSLHKTLGLDNSFKEIKEVKDSIQQLIMYDSIVNYFNNYPLNYSNSSFNDLAKAHIAKALFYLNISIEDKIGEKNLKHYNQRFFVDTLDINSPVLIHYSGLVNNVGSYLNLKDKTIFFSKLINSKDPEVQADAYRERIKMYENIGYFISKEKDTDYFLDKLMNSNNSEIKLSDNSVIVNLKDSVAMQKDIDYVLKNLQFTRSGKDIYYEYDFTRPIKNGKRFVDFKLPLYENELLNDSIDLDKLKGKYVLIDFWATSCGPCIEEMKHLHKTYETFKDSNFTILSISSDSDVESAIKFKNKKWKMPWLKVYADSRFENKLLKKLGIHGIPRAVLINKEGIIIDEGERLRGKGLTKFIEYMISSCK